MATIEEILSDDAKLAEVTKAVFDQVDADHSGQIDRRELKVAMAQVAREANLQAPTEQSIDQALTALDADGNGSIDVNEFKVLIRQLLEALK